MLANSAMQPADPNRQAADGTDVRQQTLEMIDVDEVGLIEFFGVVPEPQTQDEREFFSAPLFIKRVDGLELRISISAHLCDLRLDLRRVGHDTALLDLVVPGIRAVSIERSGGRQRLRLVSQAHGIVELAVDPAIEIRCDGSISA